MVRRDFSSQWCHLRKFVPHRENAGKNTRGHTVAQNNCRSVFMFSITDIQQSASRYKSATKGTDTVTDIHDVAIAMICWCNHRCFFKTIFLATIRCFSLTNVNQRHWYSIMITDWNPQRNSCEKTVQQEMWVRILNIQLTEIQKYYREKV